jgi:transposase
MTQNHAKMEEKPKEQFCTQVVKKIKRLTLRVFSAEEKIKIVLEGMGGEDTIMAICRKYGIHIIYHLYD